jgi:hypothetical protein
MSEIYDIVRGSRELSGEVGPVRAVHFSFRIAWQLIRGPAGQSARGKTRTVEGSVSADNNLPIREGIYQIVDQDGKYWRVQKLGMQWHLLSPLTG